MTWMSGGETDAIDGDAEDALPAPPQTKDEVTAILGSIRRRMERIHEEELTAAAELAKVDERIAVLERDKQRIAYELEKITRRDAQRVTELQSLAVGYLRWARASDDRIKSIATVHGKVTSSKVNAKPVRSDEAALEDWARKHGYIRTKTSEEVDWARIVRDGRVSESGLLVVGDDVVSGVVITPANVTYEVKL